MAFEVDGTYDVTATLRLPFGGGGTVGSHGLGTYFGRKYDLVGATLYSDGTLSAVVTVQTIDPRAAKAGTDPAVNSPLIVLAIAALIVVGATVVSWHAVNRVPSGALGIGAVVGGAALLLGVLWLATKAPRYAR